MTLEPLDRFMGKYPFLPQIRQSGYGHQSQDRTGPNRVKVHRRSALV